MRSIAALLLAVASFSTAAQDCSEILKLGKDEYFLQQKTSIQQEAKSLYCMDQRRNRTAQAGVDVGFIVDALPVSIGGFAKGSDEYRKQVCSMTWDSFQFAQDIQLRIRTGRADVVSAWLACKSQRGFNPSYRDVGDTVLFDLDDRPGDGVPPANFVQAVVSPQDGLLNCNWPSPGLIPGAGHTIVQCTRNPQHKDKEISVVLKSANVGDRLLVVLPELGPPPADILPNLAKWEIPQDPIVVPTGAIFGSYRVPVFCPKGSYLIGLQQRIEARQGKGDDTALNDVNFICRNPYTGEETARTGLGGERWGDWYPAYVNGAPQFKRCPDGEFAAAVQLRAEDRLGGDTDDTGANAMAIYCEPMGETHNQKLFDPNLRVLSHGGHFGAWRQPAVCPIRTAVCGLSLNVESAKSDNDDTAADGALMYCCAY